MAEMVVSPVIDKLADFLVQEAKLLKGVHREVEDLKDELESIQCFLKDADARAERGDQSDGVKTWVKQVREVAFRIEDVIDEYMLHVAERRHRRGFIGSIRKIGRLVRNFKQRYVLASQIQEIKSTVCGIKERSERYGFNSCEQGLLNGATDSAWHDRQGDSLFINEAEVVGIEPARDELMGWLLEGASNRTVISLVGMGGIGKTTLARKVYDNQIVKAHFESHAWITVSQCYKMEELLKKLMEEFCQTRNEAAPKGIDTMEKESLIRTAREYLQDKRYVVVFDDVWKIDFWRDIEHALLDNNRGSRIMITTRKMDVAEFCKRSSLVHVHEQQPLREEDAWQLFCRKTFSFDFEGQCPEELKKLSLDILKKCKGLPLAIVAIGGLLSLKNKVVYEWQNLYDSLGLEFESSPYLSNVKTILLLSYQDLPYHLKSCFLYFSIFPEDSFFSKKNLFAYWIAEGFVKEKRGKTLEVIANGYLNEFIQRNLVQISTRPPQMYMKYHIHDVMHEIIQSISRDLNFCQVFEGGSNFKKITRRLSICNNADNVLENIVSKGVRSIHVFNVSELPASFMDTLFHNFKLLTILDFDGAPLDYLDEKVGNLSNLRYLNVSNTKIKMLPKSIGKLRYLQTLALANTLVRELPIEFNKLCKLQYLEAYVIDKEDESGFVMLQGVKLHDGISCLEGLRMLKYVEANHGVSLIKELGKLKQLRSLGIINLSRENGKDLCASIEMMNHLEFLALSSIKEEEDEILDLQSISSPPQFIWGLQLSGVLEKVPDWILKLQNLDTLSLSFSRLMDDPLKALHTLPNLTNLFLLEAYDGEHLHIEEGGFQKLKLLRLLKLNRLNRLVIDKGAVPLLEEFHIGPNPQLMEMPSDIQHLRNLLTLQLIDMPRDFALGVQPDRPSYLFVQHIPNVYFQYWSEENGSKVYKLGDSELLQQLQKEVNPGSASQNAQQLEGNNRLCRQ